MKTFKTKVKQAKELIRKAVKEHGSNLAVACSFGKDSMTLVHLALSVEPRIKVFSVLTPFKPEETYSYAREMIDEYELNHFDYGFSHQLSVSELRKIGLPYGLWQTNSERCCEIFKVQPFKHAIKDLKLTGLLSGVRRDEGKTRANCELVETKQGIVKYNAILEFTELDVWKYLAVNQVKPHPWYALGYRSLGCEPCTGLCDDCEGERDGRWKGTSNEGGECNIHLSKLK